MSKPVKLSKKAVTDIFEEQKFSLDEELSALGAGKAFISEAGTIVFVFEDGKGIMYDSIGSLKSVLEKARQSVERSNIFMKESDSTSFIDNVKRSGGSLTEIFDIPQKELDFTEHSLNSIETAIVKTGFEKCMEPTYLNPLVAYVGEVIRKRVENGRWEVHSARGHTEPVIIDGSGHIYQPYSLVKKELELGEEGSVRGAVHGTLNPFLQ